MVTIGSARYPGNQPPERGLEVNWHVWNSDGACQVLRGDDLQKWLVNHRGDPFVVSFANNSSAHIQPDDDLWIIMADLLSMGNAIEVYPLNFSNKYQPWAADGDLQRFDAIRITSPASRFRLMYLAVRNFYWKIRMQVRNSKSRRQRWMVFSC